MRPGSDPGDETGSAQNTTKATIKIIRNLNPETMILCAMVVILDDNSEIGAHV